MLVLGGGTIAGMSVLGYTLATSLPVLIGMRLVTGVGEAAMFVGAATAVQDLAPTAATRGATSYFSVAVYGGSRSVRCSARPCVTQWGVHDVWFVSAAMCFVAVLVGLGMPAARPARCRRVWCCSGTCCIPPRCVPA